MYGDGQGPSQDLCESHLPFLGPSQRSALVPSFGVYYHFFTPHDHIALHSQEEWSMITTIFIWQCNLSKQSNDQYFAWFMQTKFIWAFIIPFAIKLEYYWMDYIYGYYLNRPCLKIDHPEVSFNLGSNIPLFDINTDHIHFGTLNIILNSEIFYLDIYTFKHTQTLCQLYGFHSTLYWET